jgi:GT2 family glycosyltransferase
MGLLCTPSFWYDSYLHRSPHLCTMISIVMTYFNRREQLLRTLASIRYFGSPEIIVVDDGSDEDQRIEDIKGITLIRIDPKNKTWHNTCVPFNMGFSIAKGNIVIIQNAECLHTGDILTYCDKLTKGNVFSFGAYSLDRDLTPEETSSTPTVLRDMILKEPARTDNGHRGWYNHTIHRPVGFHFCNAMMRCDLEELGGFDERYTDGLAYEDNEFVERIKRAEFNLQIIDDPFVIHQKHKRTDYARSRNIYEINKRLYEDTTLKETLVKSPFNQYYGFFRDASTTTHVPLINLSLSLFKPKFILELGIGYYSTPIFRHYVNESELCFYTGVENSKSWIKQINNKFKGLNLIHHDLEGLSIGMMLKDISKYKQDVITKYFTSIPLPPVSPKLLFVDNYGSCRVLAINALKHEFDIIILHDSELAGAMEYNYDKINSTGFKMLYLKNNLSWTLFMIKDQLYLDNPDIISLAKPHIDLFLSGNPAIEWMTLSPNYF